MGRADVIPDVLPAIVAEQRVSRPCERRYHWCPDGRRKRRRPQQSELSVNVVAVSHCLHWTRRRRWKRCSGGIASHDATYHAWHACCCCYAGSGACVCMAQLELDSRSGTMAALASARQRRGSLRRRATGIGSTSGRDRRRDRRRGDTTESRQQRGRHAGVAAAPQHRLWSNRRRRRSAELHLQCEREGHGW